MKNAFRLIAMALTTLLLTACFQLATIITLNKDGSALIEEWTLLSEQLYALEEAAKKGKASGERRSILPDRAKAEAMAKSCGEGVTLQRIEDVSLPDGRKGVKVTYAVADVNKLRFRPLGMLGKPTTEGAAYTFIKNAGTVRVNFPAEATNVPTFNTSPNQASPGQTKSQMGMIKAMSKGMKFLIQIKAANGLAASDATYVNGNVITLFDLNYDKLLEKPEVFEKLVETVQKEGPNSANIANLVGGIEGIKVEEKKQFTITLK